MHVHLRISNILLSAIVSLGVYFRVRVELRRVGVLVLTMIVVLTSLSTCYASLTSPYVCSNTILVDVFLGLVVLFNDVAALE